MVQNIYINDAVVFSNIGLEKITPTVLNSKRRLEGKLVQAMSEQESLKGKGFRYVPQTIKMLYVTLHEILERNSLEDHKDNVGLINTHEIPNLESNIEFEKDIINYGSKLANPMIAPYTVSNAGAGWLAIKQKMRNLNLTINNGKSALSSAIGVVEDQIQLGTLDHGIIFSLNISSQFYDKVYKNSDFPLDFASSILLSKDKTETSIAEVISTRSYRFTEAEQLLPLYENIVKKQFADYVILEDPHSLLKSKKSHINVGKYAQLEQSSFLSVFLQNVQAFMNSWVSGVNCYSGKKINYLNVDPSGIISSLIIKLL